MMIVLVLMWWYAHRVRTRLSYLPAVYNMTGLVGCFGVPESARAAGLMPHYTLDGSQSGCTNAVLCMQCVWVGVQGPAGVLYSSCGCDECDCNRRALMTLRQRLGSFPVDVYTNTNDHNRIIGDRAAAMEELPARFLELAGSCFRSWEMREGDDGMSSYSMC